MKIQENQLHVEHRSIELSSDLLAEGHNSIVEIRTIPVISDADVVNLFGVETEHWM